MSNGASTTAQALRLRCMPALTLNHLRRHAIVRSLFAPTTLFAAIEHLGFIQADPIRAPARAQDLTLRHRVADYRAGDLEAHYPTLPIEEDFFVNYGFMPRALQRLMHPRTPRTVWSKARWAKAHEVLAFVRERGVVHPRDVDAHFQHGRVRNWFGGSSNASTQLLDGMHYRGLLRVARRDSGTRCYALRAPNDAAGDVAAAMDALVDAIVTKYAPLPARSLSQLVMFLSAATPQWRSQRKAALDHAKSRLPNAQVDGVSWFWPAGENPASAQCLDDHARLLTPFDPIVWDRRRFELFWRWPYRFEAYTPAARRVLGYYALPLLRRDHVVGWANVNVREARMAVEVGFFGSRPTGRAFAAAVDDELHRLHRFLGL
jgi:uncharacterized protein